MVSKLMISPGMRIGGMFNVNTCGGVRIYISLFDDGHLIRP